MKGKPISSAPRDGTEILIRTAGGSVFRVSYEAGLLDTENNECGGWREAQEGAAPLCWTDGICWAVNEDKGASDPPVEWFAGGSEMSEWTEMARGIIADHPELPAGVKGPARELVGRAVGVVSQIVGNLELVYRRGYQGGYEDGYRDAKAKKRSRFSLSKETAK